MESELAYVQRVINRSKCTGRGPAHRVCPSGQPNRYVITVYVTPLILFLIFPLAGIYVYLQRYYFSSARELSQLTAVTETPVFLHISEWIAGATTVRAFQQQDRCSRKNAELLEVHQRASFQFLVATEWLGLRLDNLGATVVSAAAILLITSPEGTINPALAGMSLSYGLTLSNFLMRLIITSSEIEKYMVSVERLSQYFNIPSEAPAVIPNNRPPSGWPSAGKIELQNLKDEGDFLPSYAQDKVNVVGRTGSGKSTLIQALFRLIEPASGHILIDGIDIISIGMHDLRSALSSLRSLLFLKALSAIIWTPSTCVLMSKYGSRWTNASSVGKFVTSRRSFLRQFQSKGRMGVWGNVSCCAWGVHCLDIPASSSWFRQLRLWTSLPMQ